MEHIVCVLLCIGLITCALGVKQTERKLQRQIDDLKRELEEMKRKQQNV